MGRAKQKRKAERKRKRFMRTLSVRQKKALEQ